VVRRRMRIMHIPARRLLGLVVALAVLAVAEGAPGQAQPFRREEPTSFINQQRTLERRLQSQIDAEAGRFQRELFDWGGWYAFHTFLFDDGVESSRTLRRNDLRLWGRAVLEEGTHELYARAWLSFVDFNSGDSYDGNDDDVVGPNLERGYYKFDLARAMQAAEGRAIDYNLVLKAGRDLVQFGNGLALSVTLDHLSIQGTYRGFELTTLAGKSVGSTDDFDLSRTATRSHRDFYGVQLKYLDFERHEPFVYAFWQQDRNHEAVLQPLQQYDYDSVYLGIGSTGELARRLWYETELTYETGHSFGDRRFLHDNTIEAWALQAELEYLFPGEHKPRVSVEYLFGSGDADRLLSPTSTVGGNRGDFEDTGFVGFGYRDTSLSFSPRYSNLHMWRAGGSYYPWPTKEWLKRLEVGADAYLFHKHHHEGAVSDPTAHLPAGYLGWEMDCFANWQMAVDLSWTARLGVFFPGDAFEDRTTRTFLLVGMTWSF